MTWWIEDPARGRQERAELASLAERETWLTALKWKLGDDLELSVELEIRHGDDTFELVMRYPSSFPDTPAMVMPRDQRRISGHQYGAGGELCLEYRPDNWDPAFTGAMLVASAHRLIEGERPADGERGSVPSAHQESLGRDLRGTSLRFVLPPSSLEALAGLPEEAPVAVAIWERSHSGTYVASLTSIGDEGGPLWKPRSPVPSGASAYKGVVFRTRRPIARFTNDPMACLHETDVHFPELKDHLPPATSGHFLLIGNGSNWIALYFFRKAEEHRAVSYAVVASPSGQGRLPEEYAALANIKVAVVGCGSVGSKVVAALGRAGIRRYTLVDEDVFFSDNLVRNDLDANSIGLHKVDAVSARLRDIVSDAEVECRRLSLGHQESSGSLESVLDAIGQCDLIIEATADATAFNLTAAAARRSRKPMVWCEVFGGGIGGIVARARPNIDPTPTGARGQIKAWCAAHDVPWELGAGANYEALSEDDPPLVADDADVSVIAAHAARIALDLLVRKDSAFPASAYAIGLRSGWIFEAPFDTWPIVLAGEGEWKAPHSSDNHAELMALVAELFPRASVA